MSPKTIPSDLTISVEGACTLALECWRLNRVAESVKDSTQGAGLRQAVRRITEILDGLGIKVIDLSARIYDPGMVPEVVEIREDPTLPDGQAVVDETIAPTVMWHGQVVRPGQITVKRFPERPETKLRKLDE
jgi:hypothetical protein